MQFDIYLKLKAWMESQLFACEIIIE